MNDKVAFRDSSKDRSKGGADAPDVSLSETPLGSTAEMPPLAAPPSPVYGPVPKPASQPAIFDRIYHPSSSPSSTPLATQSLSFNLSAQSGASTPVNTVSSQSENHGEQPLSQSRTHELVTPFSVDGDAGTDCPTTISVDSQCDSPSLDDLAEMDVSGASREELMVYHSELMGWIRELDHALQDCQADFKAHLQQYGQQELLLEQRTQELLALEERHGALTKEVDVQQKAHQRQTILVETLQAQLDSSQERVAQMERDFSQVQRRCSDQAQQLLQAEGLCRDLKSRLSRQQRHTMQFKAALEKSLAVSVNDSDYDLGDVDMDSMESSGELFPRPKPVQPWSNQLDEVALSQALNGLEQPAHVEQPTVTKGLNLQLAFEDPETADWKAGQAKAASKAQMAYGNAAMGLAASSQVIAASGAVESVFDPEQADDLEATLKQESESILQGELLGSAGPDTNGEDLSESHQAPLVNTHRVSFVPPIKPVLPEEITEAESLEHSESAPELASGRPSDGDSEVITTPEKKRKTTLAGINLPSFPKF